MQELRNKTTYGQGNQDCVEKVLLDNYSNSCSLVSPQKDNLHADNLEKENVKKENVKKENLQNQLLHHSSEANSKAFDLLSTFEKLDPSCYIEKALNGIIEIPIDPANHLDATWLRNIQDKKVLVLAGGGGEQAPALAALGAHVTVADASMGQLQWDLDLAKKYSLNIDIVHASYDFLPFQSEHFDVIINPLSNCFFSDLQKFFDEVSRVLKFQGEFLCAFLSPVSWLFEENQEGLTLKHKAPYSTLNSLTDEEKDRFVYPGIPLEYGHSLEDQIGSMGRTGLWLRDLREHDWKGERPIDRYFKSIYHIRAKKMFSGI